MKPLVSMKGMCARGPRPHQLRTFCVGLGSVTAGSASAMCGKRKGWAGGCRQLVLKVSDGTTHKARFRFK